MVGSRSLVFVGLCLLALSITASANGGARSLSFGCNSGCAWCEHGKCKGCKDGYDLSKGCKFCLPNYYKDHGKCKMCPGCDEHCTHCDCGKCKACADGYVLDEVEHKCVKKCQPCIAHCGVCECGVCKSCASGYYWNGSKCVPCKSCGAYCDSCTCSGGCKGCVHGYKLEHGICKLKIVAKGRASASVSFNGKHFSQSKDCHGSSSCSAHASVKFTTG